MNEVQRATWLTDIHLNFLWDKERQAFDAEYDEFIREILATDPKVVLISGDIAESPELLWHLDQLATRLGGRPIWFVLGNHDSYRGSIRATRSAVTAHCQGRSDLVYLTMAEEPLALNKRVAVIGHDGWADGRFGALEWSLAKISDYTYIEELVVAGEDGRRAVLNRLGDEAAGCLRHLLEQAVRQFDQVVLLTHVPPWLEASKHKGRMCNDEYAPHYASKVIGDTIVDVMRQAPACQLTVLCGHTHSPAEHRPLSNVVCYAGQAEYGAPSVQRVFEF